MKEIVEPLMEWYAQNKRMLPWRVDHNPYHVWVSEIMLQQTRIEAVMGYYHRFICQLPTIEDLAQCSSDQLLKLWEGLGYYNRAKNLQKSAQIIMEKYHGVFPQKYEEILDLPGIGEYTASAVASICFSLKRATVDGNVLRVYMRIHNCYDNIDDTKTRQQVKHSLLKVMPKDSGSFNEALMELGETICLPNGIPKCHDCPIRKCCQSYQKGTYLDLPVRNPKKLKKEEFYTVFLLYYQDEIAIMQRKKDSLLHNMWEFPHVEGDWNLLQVQKYLEEHHIQSVKIEKSISYTHIFTHIQWNMKSYIIELKEKVSLSNVVWTTFEQVDKNYAIPTAFQPFKKYLEKQICLEDSNS